MTHTLATVLEQLATFTGVKVVETFASAKKQDYTCFVFDDNLTDEELRKMREAFKGDAVPCRNRLYVKINGSGAEAAAESNSVATPGPNGGLKPYDPAYVKALEDQVILLKMQTGIAAQLQPELEKLRAALPVPSTTRIEVTTLVQNVYESNDERNREADAAYAAKLNEGWTMHNLTVTTGVAAESKFWHTRIITLVRDVPAPTAPNGVGARHASPEAEPPVVAAPAPKPAVKQPDAIIGVGEAEATPAAEPALSTDMTLAERYKAASNQEIFAAANAAYQQSLAASIARLAAVRERSAIPSFALEFHTQRVQKSPPAMEFIPEVSHV